MDNKNSDNLVAGILLQGELQRQADLSKAVREAEHQYKVNNLNERLNQNQAEIEKLQKESEMNEDVSLELGYHNRLLKQEVAYYKELIAQPMHVIAQNNENFKKTYEEQQTHLADWMVSQKAFKELAIQFGIEKGHTPEQVIEMGFDKAIDVLEDRNDPSHNTNAGDGKTIAPRKEQLVEKYHKDKAARQAKKES